MKRFLKWLDNYWYHYKWPTIIIAFFLTVVVICTVQMINKEKYDAYILYCGGKVFTAEEQDAIHDALAYIHDDYDGDGEKNLCMTKIIILSEEELDKAKEAAKEDEENLAYNFESRADAVEQLGMEMMTGQSYVCFMSSAMYEECAGKDRFVALDGIFDRVPEGAVDEYAVKLSETEFGRYFSDAMSVMGEDTVVCLRRISVHDAENEKATAEYDNHRDLFKRLIEFKVK